MKNSKSNHQPPVESCQKAPKAPFPQKICKKISGSGSRFLYPPDTGDLLQMAGARPGETWGKARTKKIEGESVFSARWQGLEDRIDSAPPLFREKNGYLGRSGQRERKGQSRHVKGRIVTGKRSL